EAPAQAWAPTAQPASRAHPLWPTLLLFAALLFPLDVALRRLRLTRRDWALARAWLRARLPQRRSAQAQGAAPRPPLLGDLFQARERARRRSQRGGETSPQAAPPAHERPADAPTPPPSGEETLARLRQARERARRGR
ncbi:MAG: hypothetical protein GX605_02740, partial [Chloroflexi bacterium]|nr:hypothetical protein [Chloroflexota bacterium]